MNRVPYLDKLRELYLNQKKSIPECADILGKSKKAIWYQLNKEGICRTNTEGIRAVSYKCGLHRKGQKFTFSEEHKEKMRKSALTRKSKGVSLKPSGYLEITKGENKFRPLHRVIVEKHYGIKLSRNQEVHHKDEIKTNNEIDNLMILTKAEHARLHAASRERERNNSGQYI